MRPLTKSERGLQSFHKMEDDAHNWLGDYSYYSSRQIKQIPNFLKMHRYRGRRHRADELTIESVWCMCVGGRRPARAPELTSWRLALLADVSSSPELTTAALR